MRSIEKRPWALFLILQDRLYELHLMQEVLHQYLKEPLTCFKNITTIRN